MQSGLYNTVTPWDRESLDNEHNIRDFFMIPENFLYTKFDSARIFQFIDQF